MGAFRKQHLKKKRSCISQQKQNVKKIQLENNKRGCFLCIPPCLIFFSVLKVDNTVSSFAAWVSALVLLTTMAPCVLAGMLSDRFGIRRVAFIGGFLAFVGTLSSAFIKEVLLLYLTFGVLVGGGFSFTLSPSFVVLGHCFNKRLGLAFGIMTCGGGMLSVGYVWILPLIYDQLGLRNALLCASGLSFLQMGYALTWKPTIQQEMTTQRGENEQEDGGVARSCTEDHGESRREPSCQSANRKGRTAGQQEVTARTGAHARVDGGRWCCCKTGDDGLLNERIWKNRRYVLWVVSSVVACFGYFVLPFHNVSGARVLFHRHKLILL